MARNKVSLDKSTLWGWKGIHTANIIIDIATPLHSSVLPSQKRYRKIGAFLTNLNYLVRVGGTRKDKLDSLHSSAATHRTDPDSMSVSLYRILLNK
jgi:hypothetical protein